MQTPKQRPLLPISHPPEYLHPVMTFAKSLFWNNIHVTPMRSILCAETVRNSMKTRIRGGGGGTPIRPTHSQVGNTCFPRNLKLETRNSLAGVLFLLITGAALAQQPITDSAKLQSKTVENMQSFSIEKLYSTRNIGGTTWSPDGKQVAFVSNISGRNNLWLVPSTGGWPTQLTISDQRQMQPAWSPDGNWIAYVSDHDGDEMWDIFLVSPKTGEVLNLTTSKEISEQTPVWSPDSKQVAYTAKPKDGASYEIDVIDVYTRHVRHITQNTPEKLSNFGQVFAGDGKSIDRK